MDMDAYYRAMNAQPKANPPGKISGGDKPMWDADMDYWMEAELRVLSNPKFISPDTLCLGRQSGDSEQLEVRSIGISGEIDTEKNRDWFSFFEKDS